MVVVAIVGEVQPVDLAQPLDAETVVHQPVAVVVAAIGPAVEYLVADAAVVAVVVHAVEV